MVQRYSRAVSNNYNNDDNNGKSGTDKLNCNYAVRFRLKMNSYCIIAVKAVGETCGG